MKNLLSYVNSNDLKGLFIEGLGWHSPRDLPRSISIDAKRNQSRESPFEVHALGQYKGLSAWQIHSIPSRSVRRQIALGLNKLHQDSLLVFTDGIQQIWFWPEAKQRSRSHTRLTAQTHLTSDNRNVALEHRLALLNVRSQELNITANEILGKVKSAFNSDAQAAESIADIHDALFESGFGGTELEIFLTRLLFCFFGDDSEMFGEPQRLHEALNSLPKDGSKTDKFFELLFRKFSSSSETDRSVLGVFDAPYVNGGLFEKQSAVPKINDCIHGLILEASSLDWAELSPAIFGAMFQGILEKLESHLLDQTEDYKASREELGAHYTSELNIFKVIQPLFLDELVAKFENAKDDLEELQALHEHVAQLTFLDPACGCGNFLVVTYRELRFLEMDIIARRLELGDVTLEVSNLSKHILVDIDQFFGLEIVESAANIAKVALWITDHQMNLEIRDRFNSTRPSIPLHTSSRVLCQNSLTESWDQVLIPDYCDYIIGNPPFLGARNLGTQAKLDLNKALKSLAGKTGKFSGDLDFVSGWFARATQYMEKSHFTEVSLEYGVDAIPKNNTWWSDDFLPLDARFKDGKTPEAAFVSTSSIAQGEQVDAIWSLLIPHGVKLNFAFRPFKWTNDAPGVAQVYCAIIGFSLVNREPKLLLNPSDPNGDKWTVSTVEQLSPYLVEGPFVTVKNRSRPIDSRAPQIGIGNKPIDDGNYIFNSSEMHEFLDLCPEAGHFLKPYIGAREFLNHGQRWILDLRMASNSSIENLAPIKQRVDLVREFRSKSKSPGTVKLATTPTNFHVEFRPKGDFIAIPKTSGESREYIPAGVLASDDVPSDAMLVIDTSDLLVLGILSSKMNNSWMRVIGGRLGESYRYSGEVVYNNLVWPDFKGQEDHVRELVGEVISARALYPDNSLSELYNPSEMPEELRIAHANLDKFLDTCYGFEGEDNDLERFKFLLKLHAEMAD